MRDSMEMMASDSLSKEYSEVFCSVSSGRICREEFKFPFSKLDPFSFPTQLFDPFGVSHGIS